MSGTYNTEALVLKRTNLGEADRLITFLSKYKGKFTAVAKGVRKITSRRAPNLELFNHIRGQFVMGKDLDIVAEVESIQTFRNVKENLQKIASGYHLAEMTNGFLADGQGSSVFDLLKETLERLDQKESGEAKKVLRAYEIKFLDTLGFRPQLQVCASCNSKISEGKNFFSPDIGGVLHPSCTRNLLFAKPVSQSSLKILRFFQTESWGQIQKLVFPPGLHQELERVMRDYVEYLLEKELKSAQFMALTVRI